MIKNRVLCLGACVATGILSCRTAQTPPPSATDIGSPRRAQDLGAAEYTGDRRPAVFPAAWPFKAGQRPVFGTHAIVASDAPLAGDASIEVKRQGGNAVRAAVAVGLAPPVVDPQ